MQTIAIAISLLVFVTDCGHSVVHKHRLRRFMHNRFRGVDKVRKHFENVDVRDNLGSAVIKYNDSAATNIFIPKNNQFILRCPKSAEEHWMNKINFTVDWSLDGLSYLTVMRRNLFPKLEFVNHYAKILKHHRRQNIRFKFPYLSVQQWPNIDGKSASAIVYLNPDNDDKRPISQDGIAAGKYYKFEAEERRQWFVLRIPQPRSERDQGLWECRMVLHLDGQVIRLESRSMLAGSAKQRKYSKPYVEFQKTPSRKTRKMNGADGRNKLNGGSDSRHNIENDQPPKADGLKEQFTFAYAADDPSLVIARGAKPRDVQFSRNGAEVEFTRDDFYAYHKPTDANRANSDDQIQVEMEDAENAIVPAKLLTSPTTDGLLWSRWWAGETVASGDSRRYWWQNSAELNRASRTNIHLAHTSLWVGCLAALAFLQ